MGVRGPVPGQFFETTPSQRWKTAFFVKVQGTITCLKSKFLADHAARRSLRSRIHESKISKSRNHALKLAK